MKHLNLVILFVLSACGKEPYVDPELYQYAKTFEQEIGYSTENITMIFTNLDMPTIGRCTIDFSSNNLIEIDKNFWFISDFDEREQLMYHELGHCAMYLEHDDRKINYQYMELPGSIMNSSFFGDFIFYKNHKKEYKEALKYKRIVEI